jgi:preprotein translocase subunit SecG
MSALFTILAVLALVGSVLITLIVLLQNSKGGGLASNFTAGNQTFGVRQTTDILEKITWGLAIFILVVSIVASFSYGSSKGSSLAERASQDVEAVEEVAEEAVIPSLPVETAEAAETAE